MHAVEVLMACVYEVGAPSDTQASRIAEMVTQQMESEIQAAAMSTAVTAEINTRTMVEGMRRDV